MTKTCALCLRGFEVSDYSRQEQLRKFCGSNCADRSADLTRQGREPVDPGYVRRSRQFVRIERALKALRGFVANDKTGMGEQLVPAMRMVAAAHKDLQTEAENARTAQRWT